MNLDVLIPIASMAFAFGVIWLITNAMIERARAKTSSGESYERLANEALAAHKELLAETQQLRSHLEEIQRLLREV